MTTTPYYKNGILQERFLAYLKATLSPDDGSGPLIDLSNVPIYQYLAMEDSFYAGAQAFMLQVLSEEADQRLLIKLQKELADFGQNIVARYEEAERGKGS